MCVRDPAELSRQPRWGHAPSELAKCRYLSCSPPLPKWGLAPSDLPKFCYLSCSLPPILRHRSYKSLAVCRVPPFEVANYFIWGRRRYNRVYGAARVPNIRNAKTLNIYRTATVLKIHKTRNSNICGPNCQRFYDSDGTVRWAPIVLKVPLYAST